MVSSKVQLRKIRNLSDCLNDVIQFLKQEFKPFMRGFFIICGVFLLLVGIFMGIFSGSTSVGMWGSIFSGRNTYLSPYAGLFAPSYFLVILFSVLSQGAIYTYIACYLRAYEDNNASTPMIEAVWSIFKSQFFTIFGYMLLIAIITVLGLAFCLAPGIYLGVVFAPFGFIIVLDKNRNSGSVFNTCFTLIKGRFWPSLGVYFVCGLIYYMCSSIIGIIVQGIIMLASYFTLDDYSYVAGILTGILSVFSPVFSIILYLGIGMQYFSLEELQNFTGLMERIEEMGNNNETSIPNSNQ